jgi:DNA replicative helicase MCM subunit Mcm2 (Cdc46/Mcm family)
MVDGEIEKSDGMSKQEEVLSDIKAFFELNRKEIGKVGKEGEHVVLIDFNEFSEHSPELADFLIQKPEEIVQLLEVGLEELQWAPNNARARFMSITPT